MGSKDKIPRGKDFTEQLKTVARQYEATEYLDCDASNARELLQRIYSSKEVPIKYRLYAATKMVEVEPAPLTNEEQQEQVDNAYNFIVEQRRKLRLATMRSRDAKLHQWIAQGLMSESTALLVRELWTKPRSQAEEDAEFECDDDTDIPPWEPRQGATPLRMLGNGYARENGAINGAEPRQNGLFRVQLKPRHVELARVLYCDPHRSFWLVNKRFEANEFGEIDISDADDIQVEMLVASGCTRQRQA
jgi:hypothetical protein